MGKAHKNLAANIRRIRKEKNLSQEKLAENSGFDVNYIGALERGERKNPSLDALEKIAGALGVMVVDLLEVPEKEVYASRETAARELQNIVKDGTLTYIETIAKIAKVIKETKNK